MTKDTAGVVQHYGGDGLYERIIAALAAAGKPAETLNPEDLKPVDEFHIGGIEATEHLLAQVEIGAGARVLDIGAGIGGAARHMARRYDAEVIGVDLTPAFVDAARRLTALVGLNANFVEGSALDLPFDAGSFDVATLLHVGMNLEDKPRLFAEAASVLRPGGTFAVYDIMAVGDGHPAFPVPWASAAETSFLAQPTAYIAAAEAAGFTLAAQADRGDFARDFFVRLAAMAQGPKPPPIGLGLIMGLDAPTKIANMVAGVKAGQIAPTEMIFRKDAQAAAP